MAKSFEDRDGWIWMNGNFIPWKNATSHIVSQGLHYASAVFEGERAYNGKIFNQDTSTLRAAANGHGYTAQLRVITHLYGGVETISIDMNDFALHQ